MNIQDILKIPAAHEPLDDESAARLAARLGSWVNAKVYPRSITLAKDTAYMLACDAHAKYLLTISEGVPEISRTRGSIRSSFLDGRAVILGRCPLDAGVAAALRQALPWLQPTVLGRQKSAGCGDRLGLATPGHVRAIRACGSSMAPIFAQQSIREMTRTQRTATQVIDDAMWGVFQEGWRSGYGADADHLKTAEDVDRCVVAGFTFFTFDPGAHVDDSDPDTAKFDALPWGDLETTASDLKARYAGQFEDGVIERAGVKYGRAVAHVTKLYRHLQSEMNGRPFEVEVSVDETAQPTTRAEHFIVAGELRRLGVEWVSLAPRFVGRFEKGVDYIGDLQAFEADFAAHVEVAKHWGPYKLSIHSGSDKFSIYPIAARLAGDLIHLKTAGTSYLEALRTVAHCDAGLFRQIFALARERYGEDRASYHVSAEPDRAPAVADMPDAVLDGVLDQFDARQMLHVCFGSILAQFGPRIRTVLNANEETHYADLQRHFEHHLASFCDSAQPVGSVAPAIASSVVDVASAGPAASAEAAPSPAPEAPPEQPVQQAETSSSSPAPKRKGRKPAQTQP